MAVEVSVGLGVFEGVIVEVTVFVDVAVAIGVGISSAAYPWQARPAMAVKSPPT